MYKLSEKTIDISNDPGLTKLKSILSNDSIFKEDFIKALSDVSILEADELTLLPDGDFALLLVDTNGNITRKFPKPDLDNALVSALYLIDSSKNMPYKANAIAASNILDSMKDQKSPYPDELIWKIKDSLRDLIDMFPEADKYGNTYKAPKSSLEEDLRKGQGDEIRKEKMARKDLSDDDFVFVSEKKGKVHRLFPISTKEELTKQASYFRDNHNQFSLEHRHHFAKRLRDKSIKLGMRLNGDIITKYASSKISPTIELSIISRINSLQKTELIKNEKTAEYEVAFNGNKEKLGALIGYKKLLNSINSSNTPTIDTLDKIATSMHKLDKVAGLTSAYGKTINDPYTSTYQKVAIMNVHDLATETIQYAGNIITADQIKALDLSDLGGLIDDITLNELRSDPVAVFNSLPIPYKSVIVEAIKN